MCAQSGTGAPTIFMPPCSHSAKSCWIQGLEVRLCIWVAYFEILLCWSGGLLLLLLLLLRCPQCAPRAGLGRL